MSIPISAQLSPDGTFALTGVQGPRLLYSSAASAGAFFHHTLIGGVDATERGVEVTADITGVEVHLTTRPSQLLGTVVDAKGAPIPNAAVLVFSTNRADWLLPGGLRYHDFRLTGEGKFRATAMPGGQLPGSHRASRRFGPLGRPRLSGQPARHATAFTITDGSTTTIQLTRR
jgi:hypothetical protein